MACGGCKARAAALMKMHEAAKRGQARQAAKMGSFVLKTMARDVKRVAFSSVMRTARPR